MTTEAFEQFRTQVSADKALQAQVAACFSSPPSEQADGFDKLAALGKSHGFDFTAEHAREATAANNATLSDFELELVSGGKCKKEKKWPLTLRSRGLPKQRGLLAGRRRNQTLVLYRSSNFRQTIFAF